MDGLANSCQPRVPLQSDGEDVRLPYGITEDDRLAHVTEVASGLACGCRCPGCGERLVARKGAYKVHHFAHHVHRACAGAWETTLHRLAKEVLLEAREILLPKAVAQVGDLSEDVAAATMFPYEAAEAEVDLGGLRPDAVITGRGRQLLVEFHVSHPCGPEKVSELRSRNLAAVEIDLSRVPRLLSRDEHAEHILRTAPRHWLHNAKVAAEEARLRLVAKRMEETERRRRHRLHGRIAEEIAAAWIEPPRRGSRNWLTRVTTAGFGEFVGVLMPGDRCFAFDTATWQTAFLFFTAISIAGETFTAENALNHLQRIKMLKKPFMLRLRWEPELVAHLRGCVEGFKSPLEVIAEYADWLVERGVLASTRNGWRADRERGWEARCRIHASSQARVREVELRGELGAVLETLPSAARIASRWMDAPVPEIGLSPRVLVREGGERLDSLRRRLRELARMTRHGGEPVEGELLGLPLEDIRRTRMAEASTQQEAMRRERERWENEVQARRRKESADFVDALLAEMARLLGEDTGRAWVENVVRDVAGTTFEEARYGLDLMTRERIKCALGDERRRVETIRHAAAARRGDEAVMTARTLRCRQELETRALRRFAGDTDMARLWLRTTQPALGRSPWTHAVDERRRDECLRLLDAVLPKGRRR
ncbi:competence protein CoiA family protein [Belnapia rosea]|uniref:competence protein CoiA family protein n=1 Tax=Belnapia rosea TaxID=938405 RepID=UPI0008901B92|nr:competence protein CoiA family protein [Belnapia rosea]SDB20739.1 Competence protein CoiA-like family protein [Belnapia rosea]